ncbi:hypothetical protein [Undibacterium aquatile]|uniref:Uncharacterized protein n=1 Tax=Undibacterium aquatile TaxID=1537398 RepID=A0ABR6XEM0_9BURK|nr:hypothetical protein [Undibacterium aquatile]MBC3811357.1 hypothetical protein [Undibacterium aquatile]
MSNERPLLLARWAIHPSQTGQILYVDGKQDPSHTLPFENDVITRPFLLDPVTRQPIPVRVVQIHNVGFPVVEYVVVVVARADLPQ